MSPTDFKEHANDIIDCALLVFGDHAENGKEVIYEPAKGGTFPIVGIFDDQFELIDPDTEQVISSNQVTLGIKLDDLPEAPVKGDRVIVRDTRYIVIDSREDGVAGAILFLHKEKP